VIKTHELTSWELSKSSSFCFTYLVRREQKHCLWRTDIINWQPAAKANKKQHQCRGPGSEMGLGWGGMGWEWHTSGGSTQCHPIWKSTIPKRLWVDGLGGHGWHEAAL